MNDEPQRKKKVHHQVSYMWPACGTPKPPFWNINMAPIYENVKNRSKFHEKMPKWFSWTKKGKTWGVGHRCQVVQNGPKWQIYLLLIIRDHKAKIDFTLKSTSAKEHFVFWGQKN